MIGWIFLSQALRTFICDDMCFTGCSEPVDRAESGLDDLSRLASPVVRTAGEK